MTKRLVIKRVESGDTSYDIEQPLEGLIASLQKDITRLTREGWTKLHLVVEEERYSDRQYPYLYGTCMESDKEVEAREFVEQQRRDQANARDRAEFERLSKMFGDK